ncbi:SDR family oxidoreductase [Qipengyuania marisflavi]|uniref:SDR family NAD(P)-dependent oxidoreductase n=1 Tax=Qipengyuania marisflavi TaxID=2486356 RepID=A0A5S3P9T6_9SPHN|nr:SDR family NAD(P)-dependent oxidoreductase [Qipengyuania marisflavi]TMM50264.1 SDR family NAD(P)-dependent oxidoreductase [Qipengyuania marisflavi]
MQISGKTVLLTGGTAGIGEQMAHQLKAKGATVIVTGRSAEGLAARRGEGFEAIAADLSSPAGAQAILDALGDRPIDILINNAGQGVDHDFREAVPDADATDDCIYANLNTPIRLMAGLIPRLKQRGEAAIVNVTSGLAIAPRAGGPVYCATKAALRSYTQAIRAQLADTGVHVIEALPPVVATQMTAARSGSKMAPEECARQIIAAIENDRTEANVGMVKLLKAVHSASPALARKVMLRF